MNQPLDLNMYLSKSINLKYIIHAIQIFIDFVVAGTSVLILPLTLIDYSSAAFGFFLFLAITFIFLSRLRLKNVLYIELSKYYAKVFANSKAPFVNVKRIGQYNSNVGFSNFVSKKKKADTLKNIDGAIKKGYLVNCTIEIHDGEPVVALAKKIVKDKCPNCGAPIIGVYDDTYVCKYCGSKIQEVLKKNKGLIRYGKDYNNY